MSNNRKRRWKKKKNKKSPQRTEAVQGQQKVWWNKDVAQSHRMGLPPCIGVFRDEKCSDFTLCHWTSSQFLETSVSPVSHILQALQGRDTPIFTDKVSTGSNSNRETRIKKSSAYCSHQELPYLQSFFSTVCCVLPYWGFLGTFYWGKRHTDSAVTLSREQPGWVRTEAVVTSGDRGSKASRSPQSPQILVLCNCTGWKQNKTKQKKEKQKNKPSSLKGEREILKFKGNFSCDLCYL